MTKTGHNRKKRKKTKIQNRPEQQALFELPNSFSSFADLAQFASSSVYIIARIRQEGESTRITTLGTGFLAGEHRMVTCDHVMNSEGSEHHDDDIYLLAQRNHPEWHRSFVRLKSGEDLFLNPENDSAILYLPDSFYYDESGNMIKDPKIHLRLSRAPSRLASDVGVLGYPMQQLLFQDDGSDVNIETMILRADKGVVNATYKDSNDITMTEFTMGFNPGNSGGPILDIMTGNVIAIVHGYQSLPIRAKVEHIPLDMIDGGTKDEDVVSVVRALYSLGVSSVNLLGYENSHGLSFK